jgi:hypothetical protein
MKKFFNSLEESYKAWGKEEKDKKSQVQLLSEKTGLKKIYFECLPQAEFNEYVEKYLN